MSLTPMDEPQGAQRDLASEEVAAPSVLERVKYRMRSAIETIPFGEQLCQWFDTRGQNTPRSRIHTDGLADAVVEPPECPAIGTLPARSRPFSYPTRNHTETNTVDLIAVESDGQLTVRHPDNPDSTITSDVWEPVEQ